MELLLIIIGILFLGAVVFIVIESSIECKKLRLTKYQIQNTKIPNDFNGCKFMVLADYHNAELPDNNKALFSFIEENKPDFFVIAGDMVVCRNKCRDDNMKTVELIHRLEKIAPVYYGYGNHEQGLIEHAHETHGLWEAYFEKISFDTHNALHCMNNKSVEITKGQSHIRISGLGLSKEYFKRCSRKQLSVSQMNEYIGKSVEDDYQILIAHSPDYFECYSDWGADLVLSGHNHGGLVRLPLLGGMISPRLTLFPKYDSGRFVSKDKKSTMLLSRGMGAHSIKIRVFNVPEVLLVELHG